MIAPSCRNHQNPRGHHVTRALGGGILGGLGAASFHFGSQAKSSDQKNKETQNQAVWFAKLTKKRRKNKTKHKNLPR